MWFSVIMVLLGGFYAYLVLKKWDLLREKVSGLSKKEFVPERKSSIVYALLIALAIIALVGVLTVALGNPDNYGGVSEMLEQNLFFMLISFVVLPLGTIAYFTFRDEDRARGAIKGVFYVVSTILLFGALIAIVWVVYLAIVLAILYFVLVVALGGNSNKSNRVTLEDGTVLKKETGILGEDYYSEADTLGGDSYETSDGGKTFRKS